MTDRETELQSEIDILRNALKVTQVYKDQELKRENESLRRALKEMSSLVLRTLKEDRERWGQ